MLYFVAAYTRGHEQAEEDEPELAELGEVVMPDFTPAGSGFISLQTFRRSPGALIMELDKDPDVLFEGLKDQYPGIPEGLLNIWFVQSVLLANKLGEDDSMYSTQVGEQSASVLNRRTQESHTIWKDIDPAKFI